MGERASVAPWQTCDLDALGLTQANVSAAVHWTDDVGTCRGPAAIGAALRHCDRPWSIVGIALGWAPVTWLAEPLYWVVARFRHRLPGSTAACRW